MDEALNVISGDCQGLILAPLQPGAGRLRLSLGSPIELSSNRLLRKPCSRHPWRLDGSL